MAKKSDRDRKVQKKGLESGLLTHLCESLQSRMQREGRGRPSDPTWSMRRGVPFSARTWNTLVGMSRAMAASGFRFTPAQIAAVMIEDELERSLAYMKDSTVIRLTARDSKALEKISRRPPKKLAKLTKALADLEKDIQEGRIVIRI